MCDLRSLAAFRIALGVLVLADLGSRAPDWALFYSEDGPWPIAASQVEAQGKPAAPYWSLHWISKSREWPLALGSLQALAGIALILGWQTRLAAVVAWLPVLSLQTRNQLVNHGGDLELRLLLFWSIWLPLGARWSLDSRRHHTPGRPREVASAATAALWLQVGAIYITSALLKSDEVWWKSGEAIQQAFSVESYARPLAAWLCGAPGFLRALTYLTLLLEFVVPLVAIASVRRPWVRLGIAVAFIVFHGLLAITLRLGTFPFIGMAGWLPLIPGVFWDRLHPRVTEAETAAPVRSLRSTDVAVSLLLGIALLSSLRPWAPHLFPKWLARVSATFGLSQRWDLFAPRPLQADGWMVVVGFHGDKEIDLLTGQPPVWTAPDPLHLHFRNDRWRRFLAQVRARPPSPLSRVRPYVQWVRREFKRTHPEYPPLEQISAFGVYRSIHAPHTITSRELYCWPEDLKAPPAATSLESKAEL